MKRETAAVMFGGVFLIVLGSFLIGFWLFISIPPLIIGTVMFSAAMAKWAGCKDSVLEKGTDVSSTDFLLAGLLFTAAGVLIGVLTAPFISPVLTFGLIVIGAALLLAGMAARYRRSPGRRYERH